MTCPVDRGSPMREKHKVNGTDTFVPEFHLTSRTHLLKSLGGSLEPEDATSAIQVREARAELEEIIEGESATVEHRYQPSRVSWTQRVLSWFKMS